MLQRSKCEATRKAPWEGYRLIEHTRPMDLDGVINIFSHIKRSAAGLHSLASMTLMKRGQSEFRAIEVSIRCLPRGNDVVEKLMDNL